VLRTGGSCFDSFRSFGFIRGGHIDCTVLGAYEVDAEGNLANWMIPGKTAAGMGGAMDLVTGSKITVVMTTQTDKAGNPKIVQKTEMPLTGYHCIDYIITEMGCFHVTPEGLKLFEVAPGVTVEEVQAKTGAKLIIPENVGCMVKE
jgi:3-oxoacid CoA-transferase B subunit